MNYKSIILIALALCLCVTMPVAAVWQNGNWIENESAPSVQYDPVTGVSSKYVPLVDETNAMTDKGIVYGNLKSGSVVTGGTIFSAFNDLTPLKPEVYKFENDGTFNDYWPPGNYTITLPQGTGSAAGVYNGEVGFSGNLHPEVAHITVVAGQTSYFTFIGNSFGYTAVEEDETGGEDACQQVETSYEYSWWNNIEFVNPNARTVKVVVTITYKHSYWSSHTHTITKTFNHIAPGLSHDNIDFDGVFVSISSVTNCAQQDECHHGHCRG